MEWSRHLITGLLREGIAKQGSLIVILSNSNVIVSPAKMAERWRCYLGADSCWPKEPFIRLWCSMMPPREYDGSVCMAMQPVATITVVTCSVFAALRCCV